jgi:hypothetical protein
MLTGFIPFGGNSVADACLAPLIAANVHQHAHEPRLLIADTGGDGRRRSRCPQKRFLNQVQGIVRGRNEAAGETVEALMMGVEECRQAIARGLVAFAGAQAVLCASIPPRTGIRDGQRQAVHTFLNVRGSEFVGRTEYYDANV